MAVKEKTISGPLDRIPNLSHNSREHIPPNSVKERRYRNVYYNGGRSFTLQQVYDKLFEESYQQWKSIQIKKSRGDRCPPTYYDKIENDKQKKLLYEVIWQIGDMDDTGFDTVPDDAIKAEGLLKDFVAHLENLPYVCIVTKEKLDDPEWQPSFDEGIVIVNMAYHGDESTPHIHMPFIPYSRNMKRGVKIQNAFAETFKRLGYDTVMIQAVDKEGNLVWQTDENGNKVPQMKRSEHGAVGWIEEQKEVIHKMMYERYGWERNYKGANERGNLLLSDYKRERAAEKAKEAQRQQEKEEEQLSALQADTRKVSLDLKESQYKLEKINATIEKNEAIYQTDKKKKDTELSDLQQEIGKKKADYVALENRVLDIKVDELVAKANYKEVADKLTDKKKELEGIESDIAYKDEKIGELEASIQGLSDKAKSEEERANKAIRKAEIAEQVYDMMMVNPNDAKYEMQERIIELTYENEQLKEENKTLRGKLQQAYDYMKQFVINGRNMLEDFLEKTGQVIQSIQNVFRRGA